LNLDRRLAQYKLFENFQFFPSRPFDGFLEVVYMGVLNSLGLIGLLAFLVAMIAPLMFFFFRPKSIITQLPYSPRAAERGRQDGLIEGRAIAAGLIIYLFISLSDGATLLIPVMAIYWFLAAFLLTLKVETEVPSAVTK
jgi:hypothetical protein